MLNIMWKYLHVYIHLYNIYYTEHLRTLEHFFFLPQDQEIDTLLRVSSSFFSAHRCIII